MLTFTFTPQVVDAIIQLIATQDFQLRNQLITEIQNQVRAQTVKENTEVEEK